MAGRADVDIYKGNVERVLDKSGKHDLENVRLRSHPAEMEMAAQHHRWPRRGLEPGGVGQVSQMPGVEQLGGSRALA